MRKVTLGTIALLFPLAALAAGKGVVVKAHVCDTGNVIVETTDRWYVAAEYHSGVSLEQGDIVFGKLKAYGVNAISREDGESGSFYIGYWGPEIGKASAELCH